MLRTSNKWGERVTFAITEQYKNVKKCVKLKMFLGIKTPEGKKNVVKNCLSLIF